MADDPFYDGAVRTMGGSWHAFLTGAIDPAATVAVDKPPGYLWLQVAATKVVGFGSVGLHLPAAIAGCVAVVALYDALRTLFGRAAGLAGAIALAVLPVAVITARSDTMDSVVAALDVVALAARRACDPLATAVAPAPRGARARADVRGQAVRGARRRAGPRAHGLARAAARPAGARGGRRGPRRRGARVARRAAAARRRAPAVGLRLDGRVGVERGVRLRRGRAARRARPARGERGVARAHPRRRGAAAAVRGARRVGPARRARARCGAARRRLVVVRGGPRERAARAGWWGLLAWLATGVVLASAQGGLRPRYLEGVDPAIAAVLGAGAVLAARRWVLAAVGAVLLGALVVVRGRGRPPRRGLRDAGRAARPRASRR